MKLAPRAKRIPTPNRSSSARLLKIILVASSTVLCFIAAMMFLTTAGSAEAGIGQPVSLGPPQTFATGSGPYAIASYFKDSTLPGFAVANTGSDSLSVVQINNFAEGFAPPTNYALPAGAHPQSVAAGRRFSQFSPQIILAVADTGINKVSVLLEQPLNTFSQPVSYDVGTDPQDVAIGQLTTDNNPDIVTANFSSNSLTILSGTANGTFGSAVSIPLSARPRAVAVERINNDFATDIVTCNNDAGLGKVNVLFNNNGTFQIGGTYNVGADPHDVALGDVNLDGKLDIVTANLGSNSVTVLLNDGVGGFSTSNTYPVGTNPRSVAIQDLNRDGKPDLAVASPGTNLNLLLNNGDGTFVQPVNFAMGASPFGVAADPLRGDYIATANNGDGTITIRSNQTVPFVTFATPTPFTANSQPHSVAAFNRFGKPALAVTNNDPNTSSVSVIYGTQSFDSYSGNFGSPTHYPLLPSSQPEQVIVANLGQISLPSLVVALPNANKIGILLGNSDDAFLPPVYKDVGTFPRSLTLADFNDDGNLDIATANRASSTISMLFGNTDRTFQNAFTVANPLTATPEFIVAGDFNGDGKADLATCNSGLPDRNKVNVLLGNGNGTFQAANVFTVGLDPTFMTTADFNQDGKLDLAVSSSGENKVSVLLNNGSGLFQAASHYPVGSHPNSIAAGDFNLDGKTDLAVTNGLSKTFSVLLNNGDGTFKNSLGFIVGQGPLGIGVGDFNVDGKPDVATANHDDGTISVVLNSTPTPPLPAPHNDNFANAETLIGVSGQTIGTNVGATTEGNEPTSFSVWYEWTAPADGGMTIDTYGSGVDTNLRVFTGGSLANLTLVVQNDNDLSPDGDVRSSSKVKFNVVSGTTYKISVSSSSGGNITLNWSLSPPPSNDNFANSLLVSGVSGVIRQTNAGATKEPGEPNHADNPGGSSIWFRWTAPSSGSVTFTTSSSKISCGANPNGCRYDTLLAVYTGASLTETSQPQNLVAKNDNENGQNVTSIVLFVATAGTTYQIAVDSKGNEKSDVVLSWFSGSAFNDSFASAVQISGFTGTKSSEVGPTGQAWFRWVAPVSGAAVFNSLVFRSPTRDTFQYPSTLSIHSVSGQNVLSLISSNTGPCEIRFADRDCQKSTVGFNAVAQTVYAIQVGRPSEAIGNASLDWTLAGGPPIGPPNDNLAAAQVINGFQGIMNIDNVNATKELNEPNHGGNIGGHSLWFNWTAPESFQVTFLTSAFSGQSIFVGVYTGSNMPGLVNVAGGSVSATFSAVKDTTYRIAVDSQTAGSANFSWKPANSPPNDNFADAITITASSGKLLGTNINASTEQGEPQHAGSFSSSSVWYKWTAPSNGFFTFNTDGSNIDTILAVYSGNAVNNLSEVISNNNEVTAVSFLSTSRVTFFALSGQVYKIAVAGSQGTIRLQWGIPRSIGGRVTNIRGVGIANLPVSLSGDGARTRRTDAQGFYNFPDVPDGGTYTVAPSKESYGYEVETRTYDPMLLTSNVTDADFLATTPAYNITGFITLNGVPLPNIRVNLTGSATTSSITNSLGAYELKKLPTNGNYTVTPSSPLFTFTAVGGVGDKHLFTSLNENKTEKNFTAQAIPNVPELLLETLDTPTTQAAALDAVLLLRDPFRVVNPAYLLLMPEQNTRVAVFVRNLQLGQGQTAANITVRLVDTLQQTLDVPAETLTPLARVNFSQLTFRLPPTLAPGTCTVEIIVNGQPSNVATIRISP